MLEITRERTYGIRSKHVYRARVGRNDVATADTRTDASTAAWQQIAAVLDCSMNRVYVAVANDGSILTCREYQTGQYELMFHRSGKGGLDLGRTGTFAGGSIEMGGLDGCSAQSMLAHRLEQYNQAVA